MTLAAKYSFYDKPVTEFGSHRLIGVLHGSLPMTDYNPDFQPLSVGGAHTWHSHVFLDRPYYYTNNQLYLTNEVDIRAFSTIRSAAAIFATNERGSGQGIITLSSTGNSQPRPAVWKAATRKLRPGVISSASIASVWVR